ncbi:protein of unknown function [Andreprevotia lacus DSM 23236]|jgi:hypothetical protein|uniref:T6SS immunity protein Tdi1 C-terminal domain-containing protein n=1 Tax=Andreprevotia lacus DSM 23236 TaxID=1121001 RepID=A0A1W1Y0J0_9NEIS|nr:T6SS immunity protein Tdi1 domain-containing protein [Andreprevotia lacus]SMC29676.1 protein of unknown function [Andreprevotia lacus DSM 23236]
MRRTLLALFASLFSTATPAADALYQLIKPAPLARLGCWARHYPAYREVVGYSVLGHFFLRDPATHEYIVLHPFKKAAKSYGSFDTVAAFEHAVLKDPGFVEYVFRPEHVQAVRGRLGALKADQVYIPEPYPVLGGRAGPESYGKGNVWVFIDLVGQVQGLC